VESVEEGLICLEQQGLASLQVIFNIFRQKLTDELFPVAQRNNVGILARVPLASGLLSGRFKAGHKFHEADHRSFNADGQKFNVGETFAGVGFEKGVAFAQKVEAILRPTAQASMAQLALRWILDHDAVSAVIPGATKLSQAESNVGASDLPPLPPDVHLSLENLYAEQIAGAIRGAY
jgi:aryl-alcohol dehydrogenase-like predicted oxidoreductase